MFHIPQQNSLPSYFPGTDHPHNDRNNIFPALYSPESFDILLNLFGHVPPDNSGTIVPLSHTHAQYLYRVKLFPDSPSSVFSKNSDTPECPLPFPGYFEKTYQKYHHYLIASRCSLFAHQNTVIQQTDPSSPYHSTLPTIPVLSS